MHRLAMPLLCADMIRPERAIMPALIRFAGKDLASRRSLPHASPQDAAAIALSRRGHPKGRLPAT
jgi:hypothetical protein